MKRIAVLIALFAGVVSAKAISQTVIKFKTDSAGAKLTEINVSNMRYGDGLRRGTTSISITVQRENGDILSVSTERCELKSLSDDKGVRIDEEAKQGAMGTAIAWFALGVNGDGKSAAAKVQVYALPAVDATNLNAAGKVMLIVGKSKAASNETGVEITEGVKVKAGNTSLLIEKVEKSEDKTITSITFQYEDVPRRIIDIEFLDEKGARIEKTSSESSIIAIQPDGKGSAKLTYKLAGDIAKADMKIVYWEQTEDIPMSFDSTAGLGLTK